MTLPPGAQGPKGPGSQGPREPGARGTWPKGPGAKGGMGARGPEERVPGAQVPGGRRGHRVAASTAGHGAVAASLGSLRADTVLGSEHSLWHYFSRNVALFQPWRGTISAVS